jgi:hypothetical protein
MGRRPIFDERMSPADYQRRWRAKRAESAAAAEIEAGIEAAPSKLPVDVEAVTSVWSGWPPQTWNGKRWKSIPVAELLVSQENELRELRWLLRLRSGADGP